MDIEEDIEKDSSNQGRQREKWKHHFESFLSLLGYIVGMGNIWRFPYLCMKHGGGAFLIPYFTFLLLCGMPLFFLEMTMGQFSSLGPTDVWKSVPLLQGLGWSYTILCALASYYYNVILVWILYYLFKSFTTSLPWATCDNWWNTPLCFKQNNNETADLYSLNVTINKTTLDEDCSNITNGQIKYRSPSEEFWNFEVLRLSPGIDDLGGIRWELLGCLALAWLLVFLGIVKGVKSLGKVLYVTVLLPYACLIVLLIRGVTLPGALDGITFYILPDWSKLLTFQIWTDACSQIFYTLGPAWGSIILMSSFNKFDKDCQRDSIILSLSCCLTSFFAGFVVFSVLGFMAKDMGVSVKDVATSGPGLVFVAYPEAISRLPLSPMWAIIFFFMLLTVGLDSMYAWVETVSRSITDCFPKTLGKRRSIFTGIVCATFFIFGIPFVTKGGIYIFQIIDWYVAVFSLWLVALLEILVWGYAYGANRVYSDYEIMRGKKPFLWWKISWCFIAPPMLIAVLVSSMIFMTPPTYGDYVYPTWVNGLGWAISLTPTVPMICVAAYKILKANGTLLQRFKFLLEPTSEWGPALICDREDTRYQFVSSEFKQLNPPYVPKENVSLT